MTGPHLGRLLSRAMDRFSARIRIGTEVLVVMHDAEGREQTLTTRGMDLSGEGAMIEASSPIEPGTLAWLDFVDLRMVAIAHVCRCARKGRAFKIGFRFSSPLVAPSPAAAPEPRRAALQIVARRSAAAC